MTKRSSYPSEQADKFLLRLNDGLREKLKIAAKMSGRSVNAEINVILEKSFDASELVGIGERLDEIIARLDAHGIKL